MSGSGLSQSEQKRSEIAEKMSISVKLFSDNNSRINSIWLPSKIYKINYLLSLLKYFFNNAGIPKDKANSITVL